MTSRNKGRVSIVGLLIATEAVSALFYFLSGHVVGGLLSLLGVIIWTTVALMDRRAQSS